MKLAAVFVIWFTCLSFALAEAPPASPPTSPPTSLFDPAKHMRISEVMPGMKGHGLSVFSGTSIEKFDVQVISVVKNFNPKGDVVLIRCSGANLEHTGAIAGMSGSPIYLQDDSGRERMIGAFAYGWPLSKDPIAGVQPIEYMLNIPEPKADAVENAVQSGGRAQAISPRWNLSKLFNHPMGLANTASVDGSLPRLQPLATPLMVSGLSAAMIDRFAPILQRYGLQPLQAGGGGAVDAEKAVPFEPGSVLALPLLTGDLNLSAIGTVTEVVNNRIFGFGHPFNGEGPISLPMGGGQIHTIIANLSTSFKLGSSSKVTGTLNADQMSGVAGRIGSAPQTVPIDLQITYADGSTDVPYHFEAALHPKLTPILCGLAIQAAVAGTKELPQYHTLDYELDIEFANGQKLPIRNRAVNTSPTDMFSELAVPIMTFSNNPFQRVMVKRVSGKINVTPEAKEATILTGTMPKLKFRPGETARGLLTFRPFRSTERVMPFSMQLPHDLPDGSYRLVVCDWASNFSEIQSSQPFRYTVDNIAEVSDMLKEITSYRRDAIYLRLIRQQDGVAIGRTALPRLPSSRRMTMLASGRTNITAYTTTSVKVLPTEWVMNGAVELTLTIDREPK